MTEQKMERFSPPMVGVFYRGGGRPHAWMQIARDAGSGLIARITPVDKGAVWVQRSRLCEAFLRSEHTWLLMVDGDLRWSPDLIPTFSHVLSCTQGIVGAVVSRDSYGNGLATSPPAGQFVVGDGSKRFERVDHGIGSPMGIHRAALLQMLKAHRCRTAAEVNAIHRVRVAATDERYWSFFHPFISYNLDPEAGSETLDDGGTQRLGTHRADDAAFCDRALGAGVDISVALGPRVEHWGEMPFRPETAMGESD